MKDVLEFDGLYKITEYGDIYKLTNNGLKKMKNQIDKDGYMVLNFYFGKKYFGRKVHRLVAQYYIPNPLNKRCVNHIDGNKKNNHISNLEWVTHSENMIHATNMGLAKNKGELNPNAKIKDYQKEEILALRKGGKKLKEIAEMYNLSFQHISSLCLKN